MKPAKRLMAKLPRCPGNEVRLDLRVGGWVPHELNPASGDLRTLGIGLSRLTMQSTSGASSVFDGNSGKWVPQPKN